MAPWLISSQLYSSKSGVWGPSGNWAWSLEPRGPIGIIADFKFAPFRFATLGSGSETPQAPSKDGVGIQTQGSEPKGFKHNSLICGSGFRIKEISISQVGTKP